MKFFYSLKLKSFFLLSCLLCLVLSSATATVYTTTTAFIDWQAPSSWLGGVVPPEPIPAGDVVVINGDCSHGPGTVTNNGTMIISSIGLLYFWNNSSAGIDFINNGLLIIDGDFVTSNANFAGVTNYNANTGIIDMNGFWRNLGPFDNSGSIYLQEGGIFRNYDVSFSSGLVTCNMGTMNNTGNFYLNGGTRVDDHCGGGFWTGNAIVNGSCGPPAAVSAFIDADGKLLFRWVRTKEDFGYIVGAIDAGSGARRLTNVAADSKEFSFPAGSFPAGLSLDYGVMSYCSAGVTDLSNLLMSTTAVDTRNASGNILGQDNSLLKVTVYPNPATDFVNLQLSAEWGENANYLLTDVSGKLFQSGMLSPGMQSQFSAELDVSSLGAGVYLLQITSETHSSTTKLVVQ